MVVATVDRWDKPPVFQLFGDNHRLKRDSRDFPGDPVKSLPSKAGDMGSIPARETKIPHAMEHVSP